MGRDRCRPGAYNLDGCAGPLHDRGVGLGPVRLRRLRGRTQHGSSHHDRGSIHDDDNHGSIHDDHDQGHDDNHGSPDYCRSPAHRKLPDAGYPCVRYGDSPIPLQRRQRPRAGYDHKRGHGGDGQRLSPHVQQGQYHLLLRPGSHNLGTGVYNQVQMGSNDWYVGEYSGGTGATLTGQYDNQYAFTATAGDTDAIDYMTVEDFAGAYAIGESTAMGRPPTRPSTSTRWSITTRVGSGARLQQPG